MLYFLQIMTPPGSSNGFVDFPMVKNATESMILLDFTASKAGYAWIAILPSSMVSSATAASIMSWTGAMGGDMCQMEMAVSTTLTEPAPQVNFCMN